MWKGIKMGEASSDNCSSWRNAVHGAPALVPSQSPQTVLCADFPTLLFEQERLQQPYSTLVSTGCPTHTSDFSLLQWLWLIYFCFFPPFSQRSNKKKLIDTILNQMLACKIFPFLKWAIAAEYQFPKAGLQGVGTSCQAISASLPAPKQWASCVHSIVCVTSLNFWQWMLVNYVLGLFKYLLC